jgi:hypothetical protein
VGISCNNDVVANDCDKNNDWLSGSNHCLWALAAIMMWSPMIVIKIMTGYLVATIFCLATNIVSLAASKAGQGQDKL